MGGNSRVRLCFKSGVDVVHGGVTYFTWLFVFALHFSSSLYCFGCFTGLLPPTSLCVFPRPLHCHYFSESSRMLVTLCILLGSVIIGAQLQPDGHFRLLARVRVIFLVEVSHARSGGSPIRYHVILSS